MLSHGPAKPKPGAGAAVNEAPHPHPLAKKAASDTAGSGEKPAVTAAGKAHKGATIDPISALHFGQEPGAKHSPPKPKEDMPAPAPNRQPAEPPKTQAPNDNTEPQPAPQRNENNPGASSNPVPPNPVAQVPAPAAPAPAPQARPARHARLAPGTTDGAAKPASHSKATDDSDSGIRAFGTDSRKKRKNSSLDFDTNAPEKMPETAPSFEPGDKKEPTDPQ